MEKGADPEFEDPPGEGAEAGGFEVPASTPGEGPVAEALGAAPEALLEVRAALESRLAAQAARLRGAIDVATFADAGNLQGIGVGLADAHSGGAPGDAALVLYTAEPTSGEAARRMIADATGVTESAAGELPVSVEVTGIIDAQSHRFRLRPAAGGLSVGHPKTTAGTLACLARGRTAPRSSRLLMLGNNHVLADVNRAAIHDCICQPGRVDGGRCPADQVAMLERFVRIAFGGATNYVDCATAWTWPDRARRRLVYLSRGSPVYFRVSSAPTGPVVGMPVGKTGRTSQLSRGQVTAVGVAANVNYGASGVAHFKDQIAIAKPGGVFSRGGDSGSLVWQYDSVRRPVGLLFAAGGATAFANRITRVLDALAIDLHT